MQYVWFTARFKSESSYKLSYKMSFRFVDWAVNQALNVLIHRLVTGPTLLCLCTLERGGEPCAVNTSDILLYNMHGSWSKGGFHTSYRQLNERSKAELSDCKLSRFLLIKSKIEFFFVCVGPIWTHDLWEQKCESSIMLVFNIKPGSGQIITFAYQADQFFII